MSALALALLSARTRENSGISFRQKFSNISSAPAVIRTVSTVDLSRNEICDFALFSLSLTLSRGEGVAWNLHLRFGDHCNASQYCYRGALAAILCVPSLFSSPPPPSSPPLPLKVTTATFFRQIHWRAREQGEIRPLLAVGDDQAQPERERKSEGGGPAIRP